MTVEMLVKQNYTSVEKLQEELSRIKGQLRDLSKMQEQKKPTNTRKDKLVEEVKRHKLGMPLDAYFKAAERVGYTNQRTAGIYFKAGVGLLVLAALPSGEKRVFFNPRRVEEIQH